MDEGRECKRGVRAGGLRSNFEGWVRTPGCLNVAMVSQALCIIGPRQMATSWVSSFSEVRWRLNALTSGGGYSARRLGSGMILARRLGPSTWISDPADLFGRGYADEDLRFAHETLPSGQFEQGWKLRMAA